MEGVHSSAACQRRDALWHEVLRPTSWPGSLPPYEAATSRNGPLAGAACISAPTTPPPEDNRRVLVFPVLAREKPPLWNLTEHGEE